MIFLKIRHIRLILSFLMWFMLMCIVLFLNVASVFGQATHSKKATSLWNQHPELFTAPEITWIDSVGPDYSLIYENAPYKGTQAKVFAYYSVPAKASGKVPAMVLAHGGGGKAFQNWAQQWAGYGYAAISMNLNGQDNEGHLLGCQREDRQFNVDEATITDSWLYQSVAAIIRSVSFLESRSEVDKNRIGIMGISWGGYHASAVVGIDKRLSAAMIVYGCGGLYENSVWKREGETFSDAYKHQLDPANFLPNATLPILWLNNNTDHFFPLDSHQTSRKSTKGKGYARIQDDYSHGYQAPWGTGDIRLFADAFLRDGDPWPEIISSGKKKNVIRTKTSQKLEKAWLIYTSEPYWMYKSVRTEGKDVWIRKEALIDKTGKKVIGGIPENGVAAYLHMKDEKGREFSTDYFTLSAGKK